MTDSDPDTEDSDTGDGTEGTQAVQAPAMGELLERVDALKDDLSELRRWATGRHVFELPPGAADRLTRSIDDLLARVEVVRSQPSVLTVAMLGGTGVGKSALLNALAGAEVAPSTMQRPTTQYATVYHHEDVDPGAYGSVFGKVRTVSHRNEALRHKLLVDTPDMDGTERENRDRLLEVLPAADVILYVGSQEKYHDRPVWEMLLEQADQRGFAFVLNKWDRCVGSSREATGASPLEDFRRSLADAGFRRPLLFRTVARQWVHIPPAADRVEDDFPALQEFLQAGLDLRAIADVKSRGIAAKLDDLLEQLGALAPPDFRGRATVLRRHWHEALEEGLSEQTTPLLQACDRHAREFEKLFGALGRSGFSGPFGWYLKAIDKLKAANPAAAVKIPKLSGRGPVEMEDLARRCVRDIPAESRRSRQTAFHNRLLKLADDQGWPVATLDAAMPAEDGHRMGDRLLGDVLRDELLAMQHEYLHPTGSRRASRTGIRLLCNWLPYVVVAAVAARFFWDAANTNFWGLGQILGATLLVVAVFGVLHFLVDKILPARWEILRDELDERLRDRLARQVEPNYLESLDRTAARIEQVGAKLAEVRDRLRDVRDRLRLADTAQGPAGLFANRR